MAPHEVAAELREHCAPVFERGLTSERALDELSHNFSRTIDRNKVLPLTVDMLWRIVEKGHVRSPGPDGIVGWAWPR